MGQPCYVGFWETLRLLVQICHQGTSLPKEKKDDMYCPSSTTHQLDCCVVRFVHVVPTGYWAPALDHFAPTTTTQLRPLSQRTHTCRPAWGLLGYCNSAMALILIGSLSCRISPTPPACVFSRVSKAESSPDRQGQMPVRYEMGLKRVKYQRTMAEPEYQDIILYIVSHHIQPHT